MGKDFKNEFKAWLLAQDYSKLSARDYTYRILKVKEIEGLTWKEFVNNLKTITLTYDTGDKKAIGDRSHQSVKNAIRAFGRFLADKTVSAKTGLNEPQEAREVLA